MKFLCLILAIISIASASNDVQVIKKFTRSMNPKIGRIHLEDGTANCTATLIGKSCAITAGHCFSFEMRTVEFNIPNNTSNYENATKMDTYNIDLSYYELPFIEDYRSGVDWAVIRIKAHKPKKAIARFFHNIFSKKDISKYPKNREYYPGQIQGYYELSFDEVDIGTPISLIGYGSHPKNRYNNSQKRRIGQTVPPEQVKVITAKDYSLFHNIASTVGDSGAPIINLNTNKIIGIHNSYINDKETGKFIGGAYNAFYKDKYLRREIQNCLEWEKNGML